MTMKPGDALADKARDEFDKNRRERELSIERLKVRAEIRSSPDEEEDTGVINLRAQQNMAAREPENTPARPTVLHVTLTLARKFPPWGAVLVALAAIVAYVLLRLQGIK